MRVRQRSARAPHAPAPFHHAVDRLSHRKLTMRNCPKGYGAQHSALSSRGKSGDHERRPENAPMSVTSRGRGEPEPSTMGNPRGQPARCGDRRGVWTPPERTLACPRASAAPTRRWALTRCSCDAPMNVTLSNRGERPSLRICLVRDVSVATDTASSSSNVRGRRKKTFAITIRRATARGRRPYWTLYVRVILG